MNMNNWKQSEEEKSELAKTNKWSQISKANNRIHAGNTVVYDKWLRIKVAGDGNCFYRCISKCIHGDERGHVEVRTAVVDHLVQHLADLQCYIDGDKDTHIRQQRQSNGSSTSWATEAEIIAAADLYGVNIAVTQKMEGEPIWHTYKPLVDKSDNEMVVNLLIQNNHFDIIKKKGLPCPKVQTSPEEFKTDWFDMQSIVSEPNDKESMENLRQPEVDIPTLRKQDKSKRQKSKVRMVKEQQGNRDPKNNSSQSLHSEVITNLSDYELSEHQTNLLSKGLTFVPDKRTTNISKILADLAEWERRMRLREYFYGSEKKDKSVENKFVEKKVSTFTPNKGRDVWLDTYIEVVKNEVIAGLKKTKSLNLSKQENDALHELLHNDRIVIRPADKGSGIVVINKEDYISKLEEEMKDSSSYTETEQLTDRPLKAVKKLVSRMYREKAITKDMMQYLVPRYPQAGRLKGNPKIHKEGAPLRTIVNGIDTPTERLAEVAGHELNDFVMDSPSYLKDTTDFLQKLAQIPQPLPEGTLLFCFDVTKLYPSVPRKEGMEACQEGLEKRQNPLIPAAEVLKMIETVLQNNMFQFNDKKYIQTDGIAIGSKLGKNFACSYMRTWDRKLSEFHKQPLLYKRYIDDGFGLWTEGEESLKTFTDYANSIHKNIKLELRYSHTKIEFLDTLVQLKDGRIITDLFSKQTDRHLYLQNRSNHPPHTKKAVPYGLGIRIRRICQNEEDYQSRRKELKSQLRKRGYSGKHIEGQLQKVDAIPREQLLRYRDKNDKTERVPLVMTYAKNIPSISNILHKHMGLLHKSERMQEVFKEAPLAAYRRDRNLEDILVHGKLNKMMPSRGQPCNPGCKTCNISIEGGPICKQRDVVYGLSCTRCERVVYVGETGRELRERIEEHMRDIRLERDKAVAHHFNSENHSIKHLQVTLLEKVRDRSKSLRLIRESDWINKLSTKFPSGLNSREVRQM